MLNRRTFLQAGVTAVPLAAGAAMTLGAKQAKASDAPAIPLHTVVYDERFADSIAFANEVRWMGQRTSAISGDVTKLWYDDLYHAWQDGPVAIAGLTTKDAMFCLEVFGNDAGLRLLVRGEHRIEAGRIEHRMNGPELAVAGTSLDKCGADWSLSLAQMLVGCPATREGRTEVSAVSAAKTAPEPVTLVSWLLAPRQRQA
jgi:hypothetical protein